MANKLTKLRVDRLREPGRYGDGGGLWLQVSANGGKSWILRYTRHGRHRHMGLGAADVVTLAEARDRAREARRLLLDGTDPIEHRNRQHAEQRLAGLTFRAAAEQVMADRDGQWRSATHRDQWRTSLQQHAYPIIGNLPVADIDTQHVLRCIRPIWAEKQVTADRVRQRIEAVLSWATAHGYRKLRDNPARWRGHLQHLLPDTAKIEHLAAMPYADVPQFMAVLRGRAGVPARALEFTILTACRTGEVLRATWAEIKDDAWIIPADHTKPGREHRVPLSAQAIEILDALPREPGNPFVFIGAKPGQPLHRHAMVEVVKSTGQNCTVHGFRSTFRDWASECTAYPPHVCEMALAHSIANKVEASYRRGDLFDKRTRLMADWARYCCASPARGYVVPLRGA